MSTSDSASETKLIGTRVEPDDKQRVQMRAAQLGYDSMSDYIRHLIEDDLEDADLPDLL